MKRTVINTFFHCPNSSGGLSASALEKHRKEIEGVSRLVSGRSGLSRNRFFVNHILCERIKPENRPENRRILKKRPKTSLHPGKIVLYCHGGGYTSGGIEYAGVLGTKIARYAGIEVCTFAYRLSPEHPYPAALNDACYVWQYLEKTGYKAHDIILFGDSAGGNLALELALALRDRHKVPAGMLLFSPWTDMTLTSDSFKTYKGIDPVLTKEYIEYCRSVCLRPGDTDLNHEKYSPLSADLSGMPPTYIQAGEYEILKDDSIRLADRLKAAGVPARLDIFEGCWHVFELMPIPEAAEAMRRAAEFISYIFDLSFLPEKWQDVGTSL